MYYRIPEASNISVSTIPAIKEYSAIEECKRDVVIAATLGASTRFHDLLRTPLYQ